MAVPLPDISLLTPVQDKCGLQKNGKTDVFQIHWCALTKLSNCIDHSKYTLRKLYMLFSYFQPQY